MNYRFRVLGGNKIIATILALSFAALFAQVSFAQTPGTTYYPTTSTGDAMIPSAPVIYASLASPSSVVISWPASLSNVGAFGYRVYRNDALIGSTNLLLYTDSGVLSPGSSYAYKVVSFDSAGNQSLPSNSVVIVIPEYATYNAVTTSMGDTTPPSVPVLMSPTASHTAVALSWTLSTDNVSVYGYRIYRNGVAIGVTQSSTYIDSSGVYAGASYAYKVAAFASAGNHSLPSDVVTVTVPLSTTTISTSTTGTTTFVALPSISQVRLDNILSSGLQIRWLTDILADSRVMYGTTSGVYSFSEYNKVCQNEMLTKEHCVNLANLITGIRYYFKVASRYVDSTTNSPAVYSSEHSFVIPSASESYPSALVAEATTTVSTHSTTTSGVIQDTATTT